MSKPQIFISSTIYDFKDLRSSLKYFLEKSGFNVLLSERNDFGNVSETNSYESCLSIIDSCDYFILLIGRRSGGWYDKEKEISITQKEYRHAYELAKKKKMKIITFVRLDVWEIKEDRKQLGKKINSKKIDNILNIEEIETPKIDNPKHIFSFIDEVSRKEEMKKGVLPINNWIYTFNVFEDLIIALENELMISTDFDTKFINKKIIDECYLNLNEIIVNLDIFHFPINILMKGNQYYQDEKIIPSSLIIKPFIDKVDQHFNTPDLSKKIEIEKWDLFRIFLFDQNIRMLNFQNEWLKRALESTVFYEYTLENSFKEKSIINELNILNSEIVIIRKIRDFESKIPEIYLKNKEMVKKEYDPINFFHIFSTFYRLNNIYELTKYIIKYLEKGEVKSFDYEILNMTSQFNNVTLKERYEVDQIRKIIEKY